MSLETRLAKIMAGHGNFLPLRNVRTKTERNASVGFGYRVEGQRRVSYEPLESTPGSRRIVFIDFCPGGVFSNRRDVSWIQQGICSFASFATKDQRDLFESIRIGDVLVMKQDLLSASVMRVHAHGRVVGLDVSEEGRRILRVDWSHGQGQIEVPAMGVREMVSMPDAVRVKKTMPLEFWRWLQK